jgi:hypothetical protein
MPPEGSYYFAASGLLSLGLPWVSWHPKILADQLTLSQPGGADFAHCITTGTPGFSDQIDSTFMC